MVLEKITIYKKVNLASLIIAVIIVLLVKYQMNIPCVDGETISCLYEYKEATLRPLYSGGIILIYILAALLLVPSDIFRKWLWYIFPVSIVATTYFVSEVSVYSSGILSTTRYQTAELSMKFFAVVSLLFVLGHLGYRYWHKRTVRIKGN